ncbi:uncharacterized protein LOC128555110 [Mercenaria mercenaria]|uniref:uncharacterized protein LOC128555110 n=1 Tax=Mercenaria mercenaria TaxID=6596 RepID=UPI00234E4357|nr:uncharacterized protein LOC128555110 [Mercenaria mercenaria]XP_053392538.1 uncharacterized protein LOC128555110 [Mercenaria mercenaria]
MQASSYIFIFTFMIQVESFHLSKKNYQTDETEINRLMNNLTAANHSSAMIFETRGDLKTEPCTLQVTGESTNQFTHEILKYRYNFVHFRLNFVNFSVNETQAVIAKNDWIWTYKGENGAHQYLYLPGEFGYLSFGLLWAHTLRKKLPVDIKKTGDCSNLTIGLYETDLLIGNALGNMTSEIASRYDIFNSSFWCYYGRSFIQPLFLYDACKNSICTFQTIEYRCCKFLIDYTKKTRRVECDKEEYHYGELWWMLPIITGNICFAFYPLLLTTIGMKIKAVSKRLKKERNISLSMDTFAETTESSNEDRNRKNKHLYISLKGSRPITVLSTLCSPFYGWDLSRPIVSRVLRIWIIILPITLSMIRVLIDFKYAKDILIEAVRKGALIGFSSLLAGPNEARKQFLYIFGGPVVALAIYFSFGFLLIVFPSHLEDFVSIGIPARIKKFVFVVRMPLKLKEKLSGINVRHQTGYKELHKLLLAQIFMLLHFQFWSQSLKLFYLRWKNVIFSTMTLKMHSVFASVVSSFVCLPLYILFCLLELLFSVLYYAFPVINCFFIVLKSFLIHYTSFFQGRGCVMRCLQYVLFLPMLVLFCISWYMFCIIFFDGFWFLSKIAMFTYSGIIAYPKLSYGYLVLVCMALYYLTESFNAFGDSYRELLKLSIEACERFQLKHIDDSDMDEKEIKDIRNKYGIKSDLFYMIVDRHLPRRNQVLITILKFTSVITLLTISVELLVTFDKFQELSLISHVFTVLFICALPKIIKVMCLQSYRHRTRRKMQQKLFRTVAEYVRNRTRNDRTSDDIERVVIRSRNSGYNTFRDTCSEEMNDES